jgi:hypothetical protein
MPGVTQVVGKDGGAEAWRQGNTRILTGQLTASILS